MPALPDLTDLTFRGPLAGFFAGSGSDRSMPGAFPAFEGADDDLFCLPMAAVRFEVLQDAYRYMYDTVCRLGSFVIVRSSKVVMTVVAPFKKVDCSIYVI